MIISFLLLSLVIQPSCLVPPCAYPVCFLANLCSVSCDSSLWLLLSAPFHSLSCISASFPPSALHCSIPLSRQNSSRLLSYCVSSMHQAPIISHAFTFNGCSSALVPFHLKSMEKSIKRYYLSICPVKMLV